MFNLTGTEIVVILLLALVVLGPEKLPDAIRRFGRTYSELKKLSTGFQQEFRSALDEPMREMRDSADLLRRSADFGVDRSPDLRTADRVEPTSELPFTDEGGPDDPVAPGTTGDPGDRGDATGPPGDTADARDAGDPGDRADAGDTAGAQPRGTGTDGGTSPDGSGTDGSGSA